MSEQYSTVRIDKESKEKLEEIAEQISFGFGIKVSKAAALKMIIDDAYESQVSLPRKMYERMQIENKVK
ncbi:hypothetical protein [Neobacillus vireti]|uniref:Ribbon-helix-helix protein CopG domain-containing protein n=1 Tax=Neobacillus vireti LMG 21834 TaxID=1131730 RepID=A0AB94IFJ1_9BACI|nr:hypothetical protein [Neobacillus vireti]ETI65879.1 hypothetical protein BAVI_25474 [Neobacillus vireti LMG 21834]KLT17503.1 hypothetical protein AA980_12840 [Neobacillus vireti]